MNTRTHDYVIVGGGSAGTALAARPSEDSTTSVLLLEAGPDYRSQDAPAEMRGPFLWEVLARGGFHWPSLRARFTDAQEPKLYFRGRGMGGSSAINAQIAIRGPLEDFDRWAEHGCAGWSGQAVLPAFIRLEDDRDLGDRPGHGRGGPIPIWRVPLTDWAPVDLAVREATFALDYPWSEDYKAPGSTALSPNAFTAPDGCRVSTNDA